MGYNLEAVKLTYQGWLGGVGQYSRPTVRLYRSLVLGRV